MKGLSKVFAAAAILAALTVAVAASRQAGAQPAGQAGGAVPAGKVAIIDTEKFTDQKAGVARIIAVFNTVEREFKPRRDEIQTLRTR